MTQTENEMQQTYFRFHYGHYTLAEMQNHVSADGGDDGGEEGICACESVSELLRNTVFTNSDDHEAEVVVLRGRKMMNIYDGVRIYPTEIVATFKPSVFYANAESIAETHEQW
jgi:hypothetical protein